MFKRVIFMLFLWLNMIISETKIRVRYGETDRMGYVYYGVFAQYYEVARVEALREIGFPYKEMEDRGILLPVSEFTIKYHKPAYYDDELRIVTYVKEVPGIKFTFEYECFNQKKEMLNSGKVVLVFVDKNKNRPCTPPDWFLEKIKPFFEKIEKQ